VGKITAPPTVIINRDLIVKAVMMAQAKGYIPAQEVLMKRDSDCPFFMQIKNKEVKDNNKY